MAWRSWCSAEPDSVDISIASESGHYCKDFTQVNNYYIINMLPNSTWKNLSTRFKPFFPWLPST